MKKFKIEFIVIFIISVCAVLLISNFPKSMAEFTLPSIGYLAKWTTIVFVLLVMFYFAFRPKPDKKDSLHIPNGYHELYNNNNQITKKGMFEGGKLYNGTIHIYKKTAH